MIGPSVSSFLRASSPEREPLANVTCGFQNFDDDVSTSASTSSLAEFTRFGSKQSTRFGSKQSTRSGSKCLSGFEEALIEGLVVQSSVPETLSLDFAPPSTPHQISCSGPTSPPLAPKVHVMPPLMRALRSNSAALVEEALVEEPGIACFPFWDHQVEPPLCFAVRHCCSAAVVSLLLQHGADPADQDVRGKRPADIVTSMRASMFDAARYEDLRAVEEILGVNPDATAATPALPQHCRSDAVVGFQSAWQAGFQPWWAGMADLHTNVSSQPPWANFSSSDLPLVSSREFPEPGSLVSPACRM